jgi:hypothetical protein
MANSSALIYFPPKLSDTPEDPLRQALTDREYARVQIDLVKAVYARAAVLDTDHPQPEVIAFLEVFVNLIDTMEVNGPEHAHVCMRELKKILNAVYPSVIDGAASEGLFLHRFKAKITKH